MSVKVNVILQSIQVYHDRPNFGRIVDKSMKYEKRYKPYSSVSRILKGGEGGVILGSTYVSILKKTFGQNFTLKGFFF